MRLRAARVPSQVPALAVFGGVHTFGVNHHEHLDPFLEVVIAFTVLHIVVYFSHAVITMLAGSLRRPLADEAARRGALPSFADGASMCLHFMLICLL